MTAQPTLSVQPTAVSAALEGGSYSFKYTIVNPSDEGEVSASASSSWISDIDCSVDGEVGFKVAENTGGLRQTTISISYSWPNGSVSETVTVVQNHEPTADDDGDIEGTYTITGVSYYSYPYSTSWTVTIHYEPDSPYTDPENPYLIDGLVPDTVDYYPYDTGDGKTHDNGPYTAYATVSGNNIRVSYPQWTGWSTTLSDNSKVYMCWVCCPATTGDSGEGWYYNTSSGTCTFTYDSAAGSWTSNVGLFLGLCSSDSSLTSDTFYSYYDVFAPGMTFTKTSGSTSAGAAPSSLKSLTERPTHTGAKVSSAPAPGTVSVTRSVGTLNMGDAKPSK